MTSDEVVRHLYPSIPVTSDMTVVAEFARMMADKECGAVECREKFRIFAHGFAAGVRNCTARLNDQLRRA